jgi:thioredoxin 1
LAGTGAELIVFDVTDETFAADVLEADRPVVVDFWAPWCGPCTAVGRALEELETTHGERVGFATVNIDEHPLNAAELGVLSLPTVVLFQGGTARRTVVGARSRSHFERQFADWL